MNLGCEVSRNTRPIVFIAAALRLGDAPRRVFPNQINNSRTIVFFEQFDAAGRVLLSTLIWKSFKILNVSVISRCPHSLLNIEEHNAGWFY